MTEKKAIRLSKIAREYNVGISTIVEFLNKKGHKVDPNPNTKIDTDLCHLLEEEYSSDFTEKRKSESFSLKNLRERKETLTIEDVKTIPEPEEDTELLIKDTSAVIPLKPELIKEEKTLPESALKIIGKIDPEALEGKKKTVKPRKKATETKVTEAIEKEEKEEKEEKVARQKETKEETKEEIKEKIKEKISKEEKEVAIKEEISEGAKQAEKATPDVEIKVVGKIDLDKLKGKAKKKKEIPEEEVAETDKEIIHEREEIISPEKSIPLTDEISDEKAVEEKQEEIPELLPEEEKITEIEDENLIPTKIEKLQGPTVVGKIDLPVEREFKHKPVASSHGPEDADKKKKRRRIRKDKERIEVAKPKLAAENSVSRKESAKKKKRKLHRPEVNEEDVQKQIKDTLAKLTTKGKSKGAKYRREKRDAIHQRIQADLERQEEESFILKVTEFVSVSELASMMDVPVNEVIQTCMNLGVMVSINQRLDAETLSIVADEFNYQVEFVSTELSADEEEEEDDIADLVPRSPIVTVMGHVDHGKTKLLDYIRKTNVIGDEAGGITQHIGAYSVKLDDKRRITFLDTPGHEAFTAMRARGAKITDVAIIVIAADDGIMPQTVEAINHAQAAGVPLVFAINKIDKPTANPEKIKEELANMNLLVEDWGGKYQSQEISAIKGLNIDLLLEKVLLEAELLELKANPSRNAIGTVIESSLDKGRGYITTVLVENGTLKIGDVVLAGSFFGNAKAMFNERGIKVTEAGPSTPVLILGLNGAPQAGDRFKVMDSEREAKEIALKKEQLHRELTLRTKKHITLEEIGRRIAIGNFKELNIIVKGDVDGSIEALSDSLLNLSNEEIQVTIIHKAVGQISESDILLAAASNAIVIGFQVRPSLSAKKIAEKEQIEIRLYSIIYDAIEEIKSAMEGMLSPEIKEEVTATLEVLDTFKITKVGTVAGCIVREGKINRNNKVRIIRDGIVVYTGDLGSLKRFKDDAREVSSGLECGLNINNFNDIKVGDILEAFVETEVKKKL